MLYVSSIMALAAANPSIRARYCFATSAESESPWTRASRRALLLSSLSPAASMIVLRAPYRVPCALCGLLRASASWSWVVHTIGHLLVPGLPASQAAIGDRWRRGG